MKRQFNSQSKRNTPKCVFWKGWLDSQCGRACSVRCGIGHPLAQHYRSLPVRGSTFQPGSGRRTGHWTEAPTFDCPQHCHYMSGCDRQMCRSCASLSPCTSAGRAGSKGKRGQERDETEVILKKSNGRMCGKDQRSQWQRLYLYLYVEIYCSFLLPFFQHLFQKSCDTL